MPQMVCPNVLTEPNNSDVSAGKFISDLVGSERVRRNPHRRARSAPQCGVSRGPHA